MAAGFHGLSLVTGHFIRLLLALPERIRAFCCPPPKKPPPPYSYFPSGARAALPGCHFGFCQTCKASRRQTQLSACQLIFIPLLFRPFSRCEHLRLMSLRITKLAQHTGGNAKLPRRRWNSAVEHVNKREIKDLDEKHSWPASL